MMLFCSGEVSLFSSMSTGSDVIMTSNCIYDIIFFISTIENTNDINTVYQRTPDIAISEVSECLQGHHTRSVFLDLLFVFYEV